MAQLVCINQVWRHVERLHSQPEDLFDGDLGERLDAYARYERRQVDVAAVDSPWAVDEQTAALYADQPGPLPAVVLDHGLCVIDGGHRIRAAVLRGQSTVDAYVGVPG